MSFFESFLTQRFTFKSKKPFSTLIVGIAVAGISLGLSVMISSVAIMNGFQSTIKNKVRGFSGDLIISYFSLNESPENEPFVMNESDLGKIRKLPSLESASAFATKAAILSFKGEIEGIVLKGLSTQDQENFFKEHMLQGKIFPMLPKKVSYQILIPHYIAQELGIHVGDALILNFFKDQEPIRKRKVIVSGIYDLGMDELDKVFIIGDMKMIQDLNSWNSTQIGGIQIHLKNAGVEDSVQHQLSQFLPLRMKIFKINQLYPQLFDWLSLTEVNVKVILILMLLVGGINMISALLILILERTSTIGILKSLGANSTQISKIFLGMGLFLIGIGVILGDILGIGFCLFQSSTHFIKLNQDIYYMAYVPIQISGWSILALNLGTIITCFLMILGPTWLIGRINPVKAIRFR